MITSVGFVGLGRIGKPIAANILAAGFDLMVFDVLPGAALVQQLLRRIMGVDDNGEASSARR